MLYERYILENKGPFAFICGVTYGKSNLTHQPQGILDEILDK